MRISVVVTVKNEGENIHCLLDSLAAQTRAPDEVVVCDGGSTDGTLDALRAETRLPLKVILRPGANISQGRNAAIAEATGEVIACADAGVTLAPEWLQELVTPFERGEWKATCGVEPCPPGAGGQAARPVEASTPFVVAGFFLPDLHTAFEVAMGATVLPQLDEICPETFLPSSRSVAFRREAWQAVGGYPEWLDYCEDLVFDFALRKLGPFAFAPKAIAHFRPRGSLRAFFRQYYQYARGDGKADLFRRRHAIRYLTYLVAVPAIAVAGALLSPWWWMLYLVGAAAYTRTPYRRLVTMWGKLSIVEKVKAAWLVPVIRVVGDVAKMMGYPVGVMWRINR
jgi:glycosyltransferase involved in cell wall biosynthesis